MAGFQVDRYIGIRCYLPFAAWLSGHPDRAAATAQEAVEAAGRLGHLVSQSNALALAALPVALWNGDTAALVRYVTKLQSNLELDNVAIWMPVQRFFAAALADMRGEHHALSEMRGAIDEMIERRLYMRLAMYLGVLAEALVRHGRIDEAANTIASAKHYRNGQNERWCVCELLRIEAFIQFRANQCSSAECLLRLALEEARSIGAMSFELRIANDLATFYIDTHRGSDAIRLLKPLYGKFSEGFATKDLVMASASLRRINVEATTTADRTSHDAQETHSPLRRPPGINLQDSTG